MYILPDPGVERVLLPTDKEFNSNEELDYFIKNELGDWKSNELKGEKFGNWYEGKIEVTFLTVY
jgi:hypothetical protein